MGFSRELVVGRWELISWLTHVGEETVRPLGERPRGALLYTADGWMAVQIMAPNRERVESQDPLGGSEHERAQAYAGCVAYCGRYELKGDRIVHRVELSLFPNWSGEEQTRFLELTDGQLILRTPPVASPEGEIVSELRWRRARKRSSSSSIRL